MAFTDGGQLASRGPVCVSRRESNTTSHSVLRRPAATEGSMVSSSWLSILGTGTADGVVDLGAEGNFASCRRVKRS